MTKESILLLGASGQLGSEWYYFFQKNGIKVDAPTSQELDISNKAAIRNIIYNLKPRFIINCAAYTAVDKAEDEKERTYAINADAVGNLADIAKEVGAKLIHYSTDYLFYGTKEDILKLPHGFPEDHPYNPLSVYGKSKLKGEENIIEKCEDYLILRVAWLCGRIGNNFIKTMLRLGREKESLNIVNDQFGVPSFAQNVVKNSIALLRTNETGIWHITSAGLTNWYEFACLIFKKTGIDVKVNPIESKDFPSKAKRPQYSKLNIKKLSAHPGCEIIDWTKGLDQLLNEIQ